MALVSCSSRAELGSGARLEKGDEAECRGSLTRLLLAVLPSCSWPCSPLTSARAVGPGSRLLPPCPDQATGELNRKLLSKWLQTRAHALGLRCSGESGSQETRNQARRPSGAARRLQKLLEASSARARRDLHPQPATFLCHPGSGPGPRLGLSPVGEKQSPLRDQARGHREAVSGGIALPPSRGH